MGVSVAGGGSSNDLNVATPIHNDLSVVIGGNQYSKADAIAHALTLVHSSAEAKDSQALDVDAVKAFTPDDGLGDNREAFNSSIPGHYALVMMI